MEPRAPFFDLRAAFEAERGALEGAALRVLASGQWIGGAEVEAFEEAWARWARASFAIGVANGTDAITLALWAAGIGPGDEVLLPALSAYPSAVGVQRSGATPRFVDVRAEDGLLDPAAAGAAVTKATRAIMPVHLYGNPCDMDALSALASRHGLAIVEDCAQAHGVTWKGKAAGAWSAAAAWSFYPTKNLGAAGDAGAVTTDDPARAARLKRLRNYGQSDRYRHDEPGINSRLDPLQAAILAARLPQLEAANARRRAISARYRAALAGVEALRLPSLQAGGEGNGHLFPVLLREPGRREALMAALAARGVQALIHYPVAMPDQAATPPAQRHGEFPQARAWAAAELSLPVHPQLSDGQVELVIEALKASL